jgi:hypothetical protein
MAYDVATGWHTGRDWSCSLGGADDVGSFLFPEKEQKALFAKIDDVRYDVRRASSLTGAAVTALAGAVALVGIAGMWHAAKVFPGRK